MFRAMKAEHERRAGCTDLVGEGASRVSAGTLEDGSALRRREGGAGWEMHIPIEVVSLKGAFEE